MYLSIPVLLYAAERTLRFFRSGFYTVRLIKVSRESETMCSALKMAFNFIINMALLLALHTIGFLLMLPLFSSFSRCGKLLFRLLYILEMFLHCKCLNLHNFVTRADNTCLYNVPQFLRLSGKLHFSFLRCFDVVTVILLLQVVVLQSTLLCIKFGSF